MRTSQLPENRQKKKKQLENRMRRENGSRNSFSLLKPVLYRSLREYEHTLMSLSLSLFELI